MFKLKRWVYILLVFVLILPFQNCSLPLKSLSASTENTSSTDADTSAAINQISLNPAIPSSLQTPSFSTRIIVSGGINFPHVLVCQMDSMTPYDCSNLAVNLLNLIDGPHVFHVSDLDVSGKILASLTENFSVSLPSAGAISIVLNPPIPSTLTGSSFNSMIDVSATGGLTVADLNCQLDQMPAFDCTNLTVSISGLSNGLHNFTVSGLDSLNRPISPINSFFNVQSAVKSIRLSFSPVPPQVLLSTSLNTSIVVTATGGLSAKSLRCQLDTNPSFDCSSRSVSIAGLSSGSHNLKADGVDSDGNVINSIMASFTVQQVSNGGNGIVNVDPNVLYQVMGGLEGVDNAQQTSSYYSQTLKTAVDNFVDVVGANRIRLEFKSGYENTRDFYNEYITGKIDDATYRCLRYSTVNDDSDPNTINTKGFQFSELDERVQLIVMPLLQKYQAVGKKLWINLNYVAFTGQMTTSNCPAGLQYGHSNPKEYAEFVLATFNHLKSKYGIVPDSYELYLEPDLGKGWKDGVVYGNMLVTTAAVLKANGFNPKFVGPSTTNIATASTWLDQINTVPGAMALLSEFSYHKYSTYPLTLSQAQAEIVKRMKLYNKPSAMLEWWTTGNTYNTVHDDIKITMNSTVEMGSVLGDISTAKAAISVADATNPNNIKVSLGKTSSVILQYFKYIVRGSQRIGATSSNANFDPLAFINPDGKFVVAVKATNAGSFTLGKISPGVYGLSYSTATSSNVVLPDQTIGLGGLVNANIPAAGVLTIFQK